MDSLKARIIQQLDLLPTVALEQVFSFIQFLHWKEKPQSQLSSPNTEVLPTRNCQTDDQQWLEADLTNLGTYEPYDWQPGELEKGSPVEINPDQGSITIQT